MPFDWSGEGRATVKSANFAYWKHVGRTGTFIPSSAFVFMVIFTEFLLKPETGVQLVYVYFQVPIAFEFRGNRGRRRDLQMNEVAKSTMYFYALQCSGYGSCNWRPRGWKWRTTYIREAISYFFGDSATHLVSVRGVSGQDNWSSSRENEVSPCVVQPCQ
jgi:hypothetical protein